MSDLFYTPGEDFFLSSGHLDLRTDMMGESREEQAERKLKWVNGQDVIDPVVRGSDLQANSGNSSSQSSLHGGAPVLARKSESTLSSLPYIIPSGVHRRPSEPPMSCLIWDVMIKQDSMLKPYLPPNTVRPEGYRTDWALAKSLEDFTPPLLVGPTMVCDDSRQAEAIYDCLKNNRVISRNRVCTTPDSKRLDELLRRASIQLTTPKLKILEWTIGVVYDLRILNREQFKIIHPSSELVYDGLWISDNVKQGLSFTSMFFGGKRPASESHSLPRNTYWSDERRWQEAVWRDVWGVEESASTMDETASERMPQTPSGSRAPSRQQRS